MISNILKAVLTANAFDVMSLTNELLNFWGRGLYLSGCLAVLEASPGEIGDFLTVHELLEL